MSSIRVSFTVADIQNISEQEDFDDAALTDDLDYQNDNQRGQQEGAEDLEHPEPSFPARVNVTVEKPNSGALLIQTVVQDGVFQIEEVSHFAKAELAQAQTAEKDWARQSLYAGPPFENLDEDLQSLWDRYLEDRGLNAEFANMIPDYISVKEQKEYLRWLESMFPMLYHVSATFLLTYFSFFSCQELHRCLNNFPTQLSGFPSY